MTTKKRKKNPLLDTARDELRAIVLARLEQGDSWRKVSEDLQISQSTIWKFVREAEVPENLDTVRKVLADKLLRTSVRAVDSISDEKLEAASAVQSATVAGICTQRANELTGGGAPNVSIAILQRIGLVPSDGDDNES
jgi:transposase-like protein